MRLCACYALVPELAWTGDRQQLPIQFLVRYAELRTTRAQKSLYAPNVDPLMGARCSVPDKSEHAFSMQRGRHAWLGRGNASDTSTYTSISYRDTEA